MSNFWQSSNPAVSDMATFREAYGTMEKQRSEYATMQGIVNKTFALVALTTLAGVGGYSLVGLFPSAMWISAIAAFVVALAMFFVIRGNPERAMYVAPIYAIVEGIFLGALTAALDQMLVGMKVVAVGGLATQAFIITIGVTLGMLGLYYARILKPTKRFQSVVSTLVVGVMIVYLISWPLAMFGIQLPFISIGSAMQGGTPALIGIGINVLILGIAALTLIIDFGQIEAIVNDGRQSKKMEWYGAFALLVTLAWIYMEAVKLAFRLAILLGNRD
jgi:uncharacterized YccA/Bax inhibitor family protein